MKKLEELASSELTPDEGRPLRFRQSRPQVPENGTRTRTGDGRVRVQVQLALCVPAFRLSTPTQSPPSPGIRSRSGESCSAAMVPGRQPPCFLSSGQGNQARQAGISLKVSR